jgi:soluble lytic murein transglycosylase-like protein
MISTLVLLIIVTLNSSFKNDTNLEQQSPTVTISETKQTDPPCLQMYFYIEQYADSFNVPKKIAYGIARMETGYRGYKHWKYNPKQTSTASAVGAMQIKVSTARWINKDNVSVDKLKSDVEYNVMTSMKYLRKIYNKTHRWDLSLGEYNTGRPCVNDYASKIINYKFDWI